MIEIDIPVFTVDGKDALIVALYLLVGIAAAVGYYILSEVAAGFSNSFGWGQASVTFLSLGSIVFFWPVYLLAVIVMELAD